MSRNTRASVAAMLVLLAACAAPAAAQERPCPADDGARAGWVRSEDVADEAWISALVASGEVTNATELVRISEDSAPRALRRGAISAPSFELLEQIGDLPLETVIVARIGHDGRPSRVTVAVPSAVSEFDQSVRRMVSRMRFSPAIDDGCPIAVWMPFPMRY